MLVEKALGRNWMAVLWAFLLISCGSFTKTSTLEEDVAINESPKILFVSYQFTREPENRASIKFLDKIMAEGKLKKELKEQSFEAGDFEILQLDANGVVLSSKGIDNPLLQIMEYVSDDGTFGKKEVSFDEKDVSIRLQLHSKAQSVLLQEIGNETINFIKTKL